MTFRCISTVILSFLWLAQVQFHSLLGGAVFKCLCVFDQRNNGFFMSFQSNDCCVKSTGMGLIRGSCLSLCVLTATVWISFELVHHRQKFYTYENSYWEWLHRSISFTVWVTALYSFCTLYIYFLFWKIKIWERGHITDLFFLIGCAFQAIINQDNQAELLFCFVLWCSFAVQSFHSVVAVASGSWTSCEPSTDISSPFKLMANTSSNIIIHLELW